MNTRSLLTFPFFFLFCRISSDVVFPLDEKNLKRFRKEAKFKTSLVEDFKESVERSLLPGAIS